METRFEKWQKSKNTRESAGLRHSDLINQAAVPSLHTLLEHECLPSRQQHSHHLIIYSSSVITLSTHTYTGKVSKYSFVLTLSHSNTVLLSGLELIGWYKLMCHFSSVPCKLMRVGGEGVWGGVALTCAFQSNLRPLSEAPVRCSFLPNVSLCSRGRTFGLLCR